MLLPESRRPVPSRCPPLPSSVFRQQPVTQLLTMNSGELPCAISDVNSSPGEPPLSRPTDVIRDQEQHPVNVTAYVCLPAPNTGRGQNVKSRAQVISVKKYQEVSPGLDIFLHFFTCSIRNGSVLISVVINQSGIERIVVPRVDRQTLLMIWFRFCHLIVLQGSVMQDSFGRAKKWMQELQKQGNPSTVMALTENKCDLEDKSYVTAELLATK
ncbi:Ras-related protein RABF2b [Striga hermonthica]|uniref:Ras-related protein RABF2b n=1 Tax=Striga hermonthica TaxID=68872 RepID=A0A9N7RH32_STRHE|nr:Ras-related protein RABF2b [Striga hermonthica]